MRTQTDNLGKVSITVEEDYWSLTKDYDKLTIVEKADEFGTFISRKPVPAGTLLTDRKYWIRFSSLKEEIVLQFGELVNRLNNLDINIEKKEEEIYKAIASLTAGGLVLKQTFGNSEIVGISQKAITEKLDYIQDKIDKLHPGTIGTTINVTPNLIYTNVDTDVTIKVKTVNNKTADSIKLLANDEIIGETRNVSEFVTTEIINKTTVVKTVTTQEGFTYESSDNIISVYPIYYGTGTNNTTPEHTNQASIRTSPNGTYNVEVTKNGDYVFFIVPKTMNINKATMNGFAFPLEASYNHPTDDKYKIYRSSNTSDAETLIIVIS